jgi:hypothetical protein
MSAVTMRRCAGALCAGALVLLPACSSGGTPGGPVTFPDTPLSILTSDLGKLHLEVRTAPVQPPSRGLCTVELTVTDAATGAPADGLSLTVVPWMPAHGHGSSVQPTVTPLGQGRYVIGDVSLFMAGYWQLRTTFSNGVDDSAQPAFDVP